MRIRTASEAESALAPFGVAKVELWPAWVTTVTGVDARLREFRVDAVTAGQDALGETSVVLEVDGVVGSGQGVSTDILEAAGRAYVRALSNALRRQLVRAPGGGHPGFT